MDAVIDEPECRAIQNAALAKITGATQIRIVQEPSACARKSASYPGVPR